MTSSGDLEARPDQCCQRTSGPDAGRWQTSGWLRHSSVVQGGESLAWDVTVPDIMQKRMWPTQPDRQALQPVCKLTTIGQSTRPDALYPVAIETAGTSVSALYRFLTMVNTSTTTANGRHREAVNCMIGTQ